MRDFAICGLASWPDSNLRAPTLGPAWGNSRICRFANLRIDPTLSRARGGRCAAGAARRAQRGGRGAAGAAARRLFCFCLCLFFIIFGHWAFCLSVVGCVFSFFPIYVFVFFLLFAGARAAGAARRTPRGGRGAAGAEIMFQNLGRGIFCQVWVELERALRTQYADTQ